MLQIRQNQGVPGDNQTTPLPPELVPPTTIIAPWCFQVCILRINMKQLYEIVNVVFTLNIHNVIISCFIMDSAVHILAQLTFSPKRESIAVLAL